MIKGLKQAVECTNCKEIRFCEDSEEAERIEREELCSSCKSRYRYVGLYPFQKDIVRSEAQLITNPADLKAINPKYNNADMKDYTESINTLGDAPW